MAQGALTFRNRKEQPHATNNEILLASTSTRSFAALHDRSYRGFFIGATFMASADSCEHVISYWMLFQKFHSPMLAGFAVVSHWVPFLFLSVFTGALADRFDPRRIIQIGLVLFMLVSLSWSVLFFTDTLQIWHAVVLLIIHGLSGVLWGPPTQVLIHDIVGPELLPSAVRLNASARYLGLLAGPAVGAGFMLAFGPIYGIALNALLYLPAIIWLQKAPARQRTVNVARPARPVRGFSDIIQTARDIRGNPTLVSMIVLGGAASFFIGNAYQAQMPSFATDLGQLKADFSYSALLVADAVGALTATIVLEWRGLLPPHPRTAFVLAMMWCVALGSFALNHIYPLELVLLFIAGFVELSFSAMVQTLVQLNAPADIRGRVLGLFTMAALGLRMFSGFTVGFVGGWIGPRHALAMSASALLVLIAVLLVRRREPSPVV